MSTVNMNKYGVVLTGREYGKNAAEEIFAGGARPKTFDFTGVATMGSSFGDEIFKLAVLKGISKVEIIGATKVVRASLMQVQNDLKIEFEVKGNLNKSSTVF